MCSFWYADTSERRITDTQNDIEKLKEDEAFIFIVRRSRRERASAWRRIEEIVWLFHSTKKKIGNKRPN